MPSFYDGNLYNTDMPFITYLCILIAVVNYIRTSYLSGKEGRTSAIVDCGAVYKPYIQEEHQYYRLLTGGFVHFSIWHLLMNLSVMWSLGQSMEMYFGHILYAILFFGSIITGNIFAVYMGDDNAISGGLSSGLYGLMAAEIALVVYSGGFEAVTSNSSLMYTIGINLVMNFLPGISWKGHLGGACFGIVFTMILMRLL